jgi:hypothetical protein
MDGFYFDALTRSLTTAGSRRRALTGLLGGTLELFGRWAEEAAAKNLKCKRIKNKKKRKKCLARARAIPTCTRNCAGKVCGDDGCGGSCGSCTPPDTCQNGICACVPNCAGKLCGDDGCGGSCGPCTGGSCDEGSCICVGQVFCGGACRAFCGTNQARNPTSCECCSKSGGCFSGFECCSNVCSPDDPNDPFDNQFCVPRPEGAGCQFDAQCASDNCEDFGPQAGRCGA